MRVLMTSFAHNTHFFSMVPLAWALRTAGHEVRIASQPALTDAITHAGLTAVPVGEDHVIHQTREQATSEKQADHPEINFSETRPEVLTWDYMLGMYTMMTPMFYSLANNDSMVDKLVAFARSWQPDLVIWEPFTWAGSLAARASGAAHARLLWGPDVLTRTRNRFLELHEQQPEPHQDDPLGEWLGWTCERLGITFDEELVSGQWTIDQTPASTRLPVGQPIVPMGYVPYNGPAVVPEWLRVKPSRPRVCITLGVSARESLGGDSVSFTDLVTAMADLDIEIIATMSAAQQAELTEVPENLKLVEFVPLHALMPTCSAIIHHGGAGTAATAMLYGVPQLLLPEMFDAVLKAQQLEGINAGLYVRPAELTAQALRDKLIRLLTDPAFSEGAARLRGEVLADPKPNEIVPELERLVAQHRAPVPSA
ncbi:activator-dependent family glycosyltransferase [Crossiella sp. SN42]|uniref:activator-dependent family glycosyltransferase n=1 Tax=Crossiella sp. SN42 TaxID=2944808 RepID=UPI00207C3E74|nr:activator-dependent family glycosyltransferase [Crossiella sp. SN42]MCO1574792.1 activator-dependent family glycosyltransferase [Crossiella sp. SN42]